MQKLENNTNKRILSRNKKCYKEILYQLQKVTDIQNHIIK